jgi:hypothetical protein
MSPRTSVAVAKRGHVAAIGEGRPLERTRTWEEPEQPLRELDHARLLSRMEGRAAGTAAVAGQRPNPGDWGRVQGNLDPPRWNFRQPDA